VPRTRKEIVDEWRRTLSTVKHQQQRLSLMLQMLQVAVSGREQGDPDQTIDRVCSFVVEAWELVKEMQDTSLAFRSFRDGREAAVPPEATVTQESPGLQPPEAKADELPQSSSAETARP